MIKKQTPKSESDKFYQKTIKRLNDWLKDTFNLVDTFPILTYEEVMTYFINERPNDERIKKGAIWRQFLGNSVEGKKYHIAQVFLDEGNEIVFDKDNKLYGRQLVTNKLDDELLNIFAEKDLVLVE